MLDNLSTVILPGVTWILILGVLSYAVATSVYIAAYGVQVQNQTTTDDCADNDTKTDCVKNTFVNCYVNVTDAGAVASGIVIKKMRATKIDNAMVALQCTINHWRITIIQTC